MMIVCLLIVLLPLLSALAIGLLGWIMPRQVVYGIAIAGVALATLLSLYLLYYFVTGQGISSNYDLYTWLTVNNWRFSMGLLIDPLTALMCTVVTSISLMVHVYSIGYMAEDPGYKRFFSYISLFTFAMLLLVVSNNFIQLFFGWEAVGLVSYLLIGFWFKRDSATFASFKAFVVNRVGDLGFLLSIGLIATHCGSALDYAHVFAIAPQLQGLSIMLIPHVHWSLLTVICLLLFVGAMAKSAQFPLHVWLPDSMEGPTPISALIHAATMVTAGIFMVSRLSPLFELSDTALNVMLIVGSITALFMGILGIVQQDIKRVIAYSTLSQLGYMTVALGASIYSMAIFHVATHAFFKSLLFLAAGAVITGMHHEQDMRNMGNLRRYMPITWATFLLGSLSLMGAPFFSGFFSKEIIIEALQYSNLPAAHFAWGCMMLGVLVTALYTGRMYCMVFHGKARWQHFVMPTSPVTMCFDQTSDQPHEPGWSMKLPLILLAIPATVIGYLGLPLLLHQPFFGTAIYVNDALHPALQMLSLRFHQSWTMGLHGLISPQSFLIVLGIGVSWLCYIKQPKIPEKISHTYHRLYRLLTCQYYIDTLYFAVFAQGSQWLGKRLWQWGDIRLIDGLLVNGSAAMIHRCADLMRKLQTGFLPRYALVMIVGVLTLLTYIFGCGYVR